MITGYSHQIFMFHFFLVCLFTSVLTVLVLKCVFSQVDNYETAEGTLGEKISDTILDDPKYLFIGNNGNILKTENRKMFVHWRMSMNNCFV